MDIGIIGAGTVAQAFASKAIDAGHRDVVAGIGLCRVLALHLPDRIA